MRHSHISQFAISCHKVENNQKGIYGRVTVISNIVWRSAQMAHRYSILTILLSVLFATAHVDYAVAAYLEFEGSIVSISGKELVIRTEDGSRYRRREGEYLNVRLNGEEKISIVVPLEQSVLKPGVGVRVHSTKDPNGNYHARGIMIEDQFANGLIGASVRDRSWHNLGETLMTEGDISTAVSEGSFLKLVISTQLGCPGCSATILVDDTTPIVGHESGSFSALQPGIKAVFYGLSEGEDGVWTTNHLLAGRHDAEPQN
jgi:hypothetical protein